jgi:hypothetical protein
MTEVGWARTLFLVFFLLILIGVWLLPKDYIFRGAPDQARWRDLRLWALVLVIIHAFVYWQL